MKKNRSCRIRENMWWARTMWSGIFPFFKTVDDNKAAIGCKWWSSPPSDAVKTCFFKSACRWIFSLFGIWTTLYNLFCSMVPSWTSLPFLNVSADCSQLIRSFRFPRVIYQRILTTKPLEGKNLEGCPLCLHMYVLFSVKQ